MHFLASFYGERKKRGTRQNRANVVVPQRECMHCRNDTVSSNHRFQYIDGGSDIFLSRGSWDLITTAEQSTPELARALHFVVFSENRNVAPTIHTV